MNNYILNNQINYENQCDYCIYHSPCYDGLASAWCVKLKYPDVHLIPSYPGCKDLLTKYNIQDFENKKIVFVDICPVIEILQELLKIKNIKITILDHHKSNKEIIHKITHEIPQKNDIMKLNVVFDMDRAGCQITWDYFHISKMLGLPIDCPCFINYIADRDLWTWKLPNSKLINLALQELDYITFEGLDKIYIDLFNLELTDIDKFNKSKFVIDELLPFAKIIDRQVNKKIRQHIEKAIYCKYINQELNIIHNCWIVNCSDFNIKSDLGNKLTEIPIPIEYTKFDNEILPDFVVIIDYKFYTDLFSISLRGSNTSPDLTKIAKFHDGGGHPKASGMAMNYNNLHSYFIIE